MHTIGSKKMMCAVEIIFSPANCQTCKSCTFTMPGKASNNSLLRESIFMWFGIVCSRIKPDSFTAKKKKKRNKVQVTVSRFAIIGIFNENKNSLYG